MPKPRILFVEDEDYIARVIKSSLEDAGYEVFRANSLVQGRVEAATRSPELLILDLGLPDGDGTDLIRTLRSYSSVPLLSKLNLCIRATSAQNACNLMFSPLFLKTSPC